MGKYMRKGRVTGGDVAMVEVADQFSGVRTRARAALDYLQLRSRRLVKTQLFPSYKGTSFGPSNRGRSCPTKEEDGITVVATSFGDNLLDLNSRERRERETTPCGSMQNSETVQTPISINHPSVRRAKESGCKRIPSPREVEDFFEEAEKMQQMLFMEKYNFDPVNDCPLPGRYEWVMLESS